MEVQVIAMEMQVWQMVVKTERELLDRRLEREARHGRPTVESTTRGTRRSVRRWRLNPFRATRVQTREAT